VTTALAERNSSRMNDEEAAPWWLVLALALNAYATVRLNVDKEDDTIASILRLRIKFFNIAVAGESFLLLVMLVGYAFLENFTSPH
jgi:hypothetical protein